MLSAYLLTWLRLSAFPRKITARERGEAQKLPYVGAKVSRMVGCTRLNMYPFHYLLYADRRIPLSWTYPRSWYVLYISPTPHAIQTKRFTETMRESERFKALSLFNTIYGIGPATARTLYDRGLRSLRDLEAYYEVDAGSKLAENNESTDMDIRIALELRDDLMRTCESLVRTGAKNLRANTHTAYRARKLKRYMPRSWIISTPWSPVVSVPSLAGMYPSLDIEPFFQKPHSPGTVAGSRKAMISTLSLLIRMQSRPKIFVDVSSTVCDLRAW